MVYMNFRGTKSEGRDLVDAIAHNCACQFGFFGIRQVTCVPHQALMDDQAWLDGLLFARWWCARTAPGAATRVYLP